MRGLRELVLHNVLVGEDFMDFFSTTWSGTIFVGYYCRSERKEKYYKGYVVHVCCVGRIDCGC